MIRYNWKKILRESKGKISDLMLIVWYVTYNYPPTSKRDRLFKFYGRDYSGDSFLIYPEGIYKYRKSASDSEWAAYIGIASYRSYNDYIINQQLTLEVERVPKRLQPIIKRNRLLKIEDGYIHFEYEKSYLEK
ncbi:hypothetical protein CMI37_05645 [Candidatus Pacearchaeota archaeon]|nr:hypothetical protein [Candidatus Pacearchaeota archaeon]